ASLSPDAQIAVQDLNGNLATSANNVVTLFLVNNPGNATLKGATQVAAVNGVATFTGVSLNRSGTAYTVNASASALSQPGVSSSSDITNGPASALAFKTQPASVVSGALEASAIQVSVVDASGNVITSATDAITISINSGPTGAGFVAGSTLT